jgi:hypothetical protein
MSCLRVTTMALIICKLCRCWKGLTASM